MPRFSPPLREVGISREVEGSSQAALGATSPSLRLMNPALSPPRGN
jgi:hypothetical protein